MNSKNEASASFFFACFDRNSRFGSLWDVESLGHIVNKILNKPAFVAAVSLSLAFVAISADGTLHKYFSLKSTESELDQRIYNLRNDSQRLKFQIEQSKSLKFLERQAREQLDYVGENELVFVFADDAE